MIDTIQDNVCAIGTEPIQSADGLLLAAQMERAIELHRSRGWTVVPVPAGHKAPRIPGWNDVVYASAEDVVTTFNRFANGYAQQQVGGGMHFNLVLLDGKASNDTFDVDLDHPLAVELAPKILPPTGAVAGRDGKPASRWLYRIPEFEHDLEQYWLTSNKGAGTLALELRGNRCGSVIPPGMHESREAIRWEEGKGDAPAVVSAEALLAACGTLAAAVLVALNWDKSTRHALALNVSGWLAKDAGWSRDEVREWIHLVATAAHDEEALKRLDDVDSTFRQLEERGRSKVNGYTGVSEILGKETADLLAKFFQIDEDSRLRGVSLRDRIRRRVLSSRLNRDDRIKLAEDIIADLDARGVRYRDADVPETGYYFDRETSKLTYINWGAKPLDFWVSPFADRLYTDYLMTQNELALFNNVRSEYLRDCPTVQPDKLCKITDDALYVQLSDADMLHVSKDGLTRHSNGERGVLFQATGMEPPDLVIGSIPDHPSRVLRTLIDQLSLQTHSILSDHELRSLLEVYFHLAPWFWRWKGMELPMLICVGEAGSGKSDLWNLILGVHFGATLGPTSLYTMPKDLTALEAYLLRARGFLVVDNFRYGAIRSWVSSFEAAMATAITFGVLVYRPYYTQKEARVPIKAIPAITTTSMPTFEEDVIDRSIVIHFGRIDFENGGGKDRTQRWAANALRDKPGRRLIYTDMLSAARRFLMLAAEDSPRHQKATTRLTGFGQGLLLMAEAIGGDELRCTIEGVIDKLPSVIGQAQLETDKALQTMLEFALARYEQIESDPGAAYFQLADICAFSLQAGTGQLVSPFTSPQELRSYVNRMKQLVWKQTGIMVSERKRRGVTFYTLDLELMREWTGASMHEESARSP